MSLAGYSMVENGSDGLSLIGPIRRVRSGELLPDPKEGLMLTHTHHHDSATHHEAAAHHFQLAHLAHLAGNHLESAHQAIRCPILP